MINSVINMLINDCSTFDSSSKSTDDVTLWTKIPFKDQRSADTVRKQMTDLGSKIGIYLKTVFTSKKLEMALNHREKKPTVRLVYTSNFHSDFCR